MAELKRRVAKEADAPKRTSIGKRNRIKSTQPKRIDGKSDFQASTLLVFPTDELGLCTGLRKELLRVAERVKGDKSKIQLLKATLSIGMKHVGAKFDHSTAVNKVGGLKSRSGAIAARAEAEAAILAELEAEAAKSDKK